MQTYVEKEKTVAVNSQPATSNNETAPVAEAINNAAVESVVSKSQENQAQTVNSEVSTVATSATYR